MKYVYVRGQVRPGAREMHPLARHPKYAGKSQYCSDPRHHFAEAPWSEAKRAVALLFVEILQAQLGRQARYLPLLLQNNATYPRHFEAENLLTSMHFPYYERSKSPKFSRASREISVKGVLAYYT